MKTTITNVLTRDEEVFVNDNNTVDNMISFIICKTKTTCNLLNKEYREKIRNEYNLRETVSRNGKDYVCFCEKFDALARQPIKLRNPF